MKELIGKTVSRVFISEDKESLVFVTDTGNYRFDAVGDCCSRSWFNDTEGIELLLGTRVTGVTKQIEDDSEEIEDNFCTGLLRFYSITLLTPSGNVRINFRNSSNGYYGGSCKFVGKLKRVSEGYISVERDVTG